MMVETVELSSLTGYQSFQELLIREGRPYAGTNISAAITPPAGSGNTSIATTGTLPQVGHALYVEEVQASLSQPAMGFVSVTADNGGSGKFNNWVAYFVSAPGVPQRWSFRGLFRGFQLSSNSPFGMNVVRMLSATPGTDTIYGAISAFGVRLTDDFDFNAPKVAMFVGDSTFEGTGPTKTTTMWPFLVKAYLATLGIRIRVVLKGVSGVNSTDVENYRAAGFYDIAKCDLCVYSAGINDAGQAVSDATYVANLTAFWAWFSKRYPTATMEVTGVTPLENNTHETRAVGLRTAAAAYVASVNSPRLKFADLGGSFNRTVSTNYASSDTPGSRVHPNDTGSAGVGAAFNAAWPGLGVTV